MVAEKQRITVSEAAKILGVSPQFIRIAMQQKALDIGTCVKMSSVWTYHICPEKLKNYIGVQCALFEADGGAWKLHAINISSGMKRSFEKGGQNSLDAIQRANNKITKLMKDAGVNSVDGLLAGVEKKKAEVVKAYENLGDAADKAFKKKLDIHSPSRVFKKSGEYTVDGLIQGIESSSKNVGKSAEQLGNILVKELSDKIKNKDLKTNGKGYSDVTIAKWWKAVVNATYAGTTAHTRALQKYYAARNKVTNNGEKQRKSLEKQRAAYQKKLEKEQKERQKKLEAQRKAFEKKQQALVTNLQNKIEMRDLKTNGNGYNEKTIKTYWDKVVKAKYIRYQHI